jgi:hypothetical protein
MDSEVNRIGVWLFILSLVGTAVASGLGILVAPATLTPVRRLHLALT